MKRYLKNGMILALSASMAASMLTGCAKYVDPKKYDTTVVASYNGWDITLAEANYMVRQEQYYMESLYLQWLQSDIDWSVLQESGRSWQEDVKTEEMEKLIQTALLCSKAEEYGIRLSEEDQAEVAEKVKKALDDSPKTLVERGSATEEVVTKVYTNNALANRVWEYLVSDIDTSVNEEEYRHKTFDYILLKGIAEQEDASEEASGSEKESESEEATEPAAEPIEQDLKKVMGEIRKEFEDGSSMDDITEAYKAKGYDVTRSYVTLGKDDNKNTYGPQCFECSTGENFVYDAGEDGLFLFNCTNDDNEEEKQRAIDAELKTRKDARFKEKYEELVKSVDPYTIDHRMWHGINFDTPIYVKED